MLAVGLNYLSLVSVSVYRSLSGPTSQLCSSFSSFTTSLQCAVCLIQSHIQSYDNLPSMPIQQPKLLKQVVLHGHELGSRLCAQL
jgi:hypothetical protein